LANKEIEVFFEEKLLTHNKNPKYPAVTLDSYPYSEYPHFPIKSVSAKVKTKNNILQKLCGAT